MTPSPPRAGRPPSGGESSLPPRCRHGPGSPRTTGPPRATGHPVPQGALLHSAPDPPQCIRPTTAHPTHHRAPVRRRGLLGHRAVPGRWILPGRRNPHAHRGGTAPARLSPPSNRPTQSASKFASITAAGLQRQELAGRVLRPEDARRPGGSSRETTSPRARGGQPGLEGFSDRSRGNR
jgi:hypothetical protein